MSTESEAVLPIFRKLAPEFASTVDATVEDLIDECVLWLDSETFGSRTSSAVARLVAHELTLQAREAATSTGSSGVGPVTSIGSVAFAGPSVSSHSHEDEYYRQTRHGLAFLQIRDSRAEVGFGLLT